MEREDERRTEIVDDREPLVPHRSSDDSGEGWGDRPDDNDERLINDRPPHW